MTKRKIDIAPAAEAPTPEPTPAPASAPKEKHAATATLSSLVKQCMEFKLDADDSDCELLSDILSEWQRGAYSFPVVAASAALEALDIMTGVDDLGCAEFRSLLNLFSEAVNGRGYGRLQETLISRFLKEGHREMNIDRAVAILMSEFDAINGQIRMARDVLQDPPEEVADALLEAADKLRKKRAEVSNGQ